MDEQDQRIAIAEACGWHYERIDADGGCYGWVAPGGGNLQTAPDCFPDFLHDLNAMHEAEKALNPVQRRAYIRELWSLYPGNQTEHYYKAIFTTAAQRAEAFLRTIGKWKEAL